MQVGLRPNAAGKLKTSSYYPDTRAIYISAEVQGAKGRSVNVPVNIMADSILQSRLQDGKVSDGYFFVKSNGKPVSSKDMTDVLKQVKIPGLIYDSATKKTYDSLAPEGKAGEVPGKRGSELLRNLHAKIAQRSGISLERIAYLEGRSLKAAAQGNVGEQATYLGDYPGDLDPDGPDARNANIVSTYFAEAASEAGFNVTEAVPPPSQRVGRATPGYESFFEAPVETAKMPAPVTPEPETGPMTLNDLPQSTKDAMTKAGFKIDWVKLAKASKPVLKVVAPPIGFAVATLAAKETKADVTKNLKELGLPDSVSDVGGSIAGATEYLPIAPSDVVAAGQSMASPVADPGSARPIERIMADQPELFNSTKSEEDNFLTMQP
tara:strand:- start:246 stop:1382 length:1137 start_codon:yes stop_codon:yes gene_type:complete